MDYVFDGHVAHLDSPDDLEQVLDGVIDLYLGILGADVSEIIEVFEDLGFDVEKYDEEEGE